MKLSHLINAKLQKTDCFGNTIKFPRLTKNKYYVVACKIVKYLGISDDLAKFQCLGSQNYLCMTRRQMRGVHIEKLGDLKNIMTGSGTCIDVFSNGKSVSQVLDEIEIRKHFI